MAIIRNDPNQGKAVAALLAVLVLTVAVTVYRVQLTQAVRAGVIPTPVALRSSEHNPSMSVVGRPDRNPFKKPAVLEMAIADGSAASSAAVPMSGVSGGVPLPAVRQGLQPMSLTPLMQDAEYGEQDYQSEESPSEPPSFVLMATVLTNGRSSAVLRIGDSQVKVVRVGDMADSRFKLCSVTSDQAVLSDGTTKVVAKRGRTEDEQITGS